jgi:hypothetical protein
MRKINHYKIWFFFTPFLFLALIISGCQVFLPTPTPALPPQRPPAADPFTQRIDGEDGRMFELTGPSANLYPGTQAGYQLTVFNGSNELWEDSYCLVLIDNGGLIALLAEDDFSLHPRDGINTHLQVTFPEDIQPAPYGLSFIIPARWSSVNTINLELGETREQNAGPWPQVECP